MKKRTCNTRQKVYGNFLALLLLAACPFAAQSQTVIIDPNGAGGFELGNDFTANGWTVNNFTANNTNKWFVGNAGAPSSGTNCAYISNDAAGSAYQYTTGSPSRVMFSRSVTFPAGQTYIILSFKLKLSGKSQYDDLSVFLKAPSATTQPVRSDKAVPGITNAARIATFSMEGSGYVTKTLYVPAEAAGNRTAATTRELIFYWENDQVTGGVQPPAGIDEISLTSSAAAPAPPVNDDAAGALPLTINPDNNYTVIATGTTLGATQSPEAAPSCASGYINDDVWFTFTATQACYRILASNFSDGTNTDLRYVLYSGTPGSLVPVTGLCSFYLYDVRNLTAGTTYYLRVFTGSFGSSPDNPVSFNIGIISPPANDNCPQAVNIPVGSGTTCGASVPGTVTGATYDPAIPISCSTNPQQDVWYSFVATASNHKIALTASGSGTDLWMAVFSDCGQTVVSGGSCSGFPNNIKTLNGLTPGNTYYVKVWEYLGKAADFTICAATIVPPVNDECTGAISLAVNPVGISCGPSVPYTTENASPSAGVTGCSNNVRDVWFSFQATDTVHRVDLVGNGGGTDPSMAVYSDCGATQILTCTPTGIQVLSGLSPGNTYYIRVWTTNPNVSVSSFGLCVGNLPPPPPPPANDECANATALLLTIVPAGGFECSQVGYNINGATLSTPPPSCMSSGRDVWFSFQPVISTARVRLTFGSGQWYTAVYSDCGTTLVSGGGCNNSTFKSLTGLTPGQTYYIRVMTDQTSPLGGYSYSVCVSSDPVPPVNDECAGAISIPVNPDAICSTTTAATTLGATTSSPAAGGCASSANARNDVWYSFVATDTAQAINAMGNIEVYMRVYSDCGNTPLTNACTGNWTNVYGLTPGNTYYLRVWGRSGFAANFDLCIGKVPANDLPRQALPLTVNGSSSTIYSNYGGTVNPGEPFLRGSSIVDPGHIVWFKFIAPASGFVRAKLIPAENNLRASMTAFSATDSSDLTSFVPLVSPARKHVDARNHDTLTAFIPDLTPGQTYYLGAGGTPVGTADGSGTGIQGGIVAGKFSLSVDDVDAGMIIKLPFAGCGGQGYEQAFVGTGYWQTLTGDNGKLVAQIRKNTGATSASYRSWVNINNSGSVRQHNTGTYYLDRNFAFNNVNSTTGDYDIQLFFTDEELAALQAASPVTLADLKATRQDVNTCQADASTNGALGGALLPATSYSSVNGLNRIQVNSSRLGNFYIHAGNTPLPVTLIYFTGKHKGAANVLDWKTAEEKNFSHFVLQRSANGKDFNDLATVPVNGPGKEQLYSYTDERPLTGTNYYRLKMVDADGTTAVSTVVQLSGSVATGFPVTIYPNPAKHQVTVDLPWNGEAGQMQLLDINGKILRTTAVKSRSEILNISALPGGTYMIRYIDANHTAISKFTKE